MPLFSSVSLLGVPLRPQSQDVRPRKSGQALPLMPVSAKVFSGVRKAVVENMAPRIAIKTRNFFII